MNSQLLHRARWPAAFTAAYLLAATIAAVATGNGEFVFYILVMLVLVGLIAWMHLRIGLSRGLLWCLSIWGLMHMAGGLVPVPETWPINGEQRVLYSWWLVPGSLKFDHIVHAFGFGTTTWLCWQALQSRWPGTRAAFGPIVLCVLAALGCGALNELIEFIATLTLPDTNVGGYINTGWDLVANAVGATLAGIAIGVGYAGDSTT